MISLQLPGRGRSRLLSHVLDTGNGAFLSSKPLKHKAFITSESKAGSPRVQDRDSRLRTTLQVIKLDIVNRVADRTGVPKMKAEQAVDALFNSMKEALARGERIELRGFGVFVVKPRKRGIGRNPRTSEEVAIPPGKTIRFKPGKELQARGFSADDDANANGADETNVSREASLTSAEY